MRKLASIQKVLNVEKHPEADNLDIVTILGWKCITGRNEFKKDELVIYCEIDSVLPELPELEFLRARCFVDNGIIKGFRLRTIKLRKVFSQGLVLPISILNNKKYKNDVRENPRYDFQEGKDVTELLGVLKYEKPIPACLQGKVKGNFPEFIPKTDETRVALLQNLLTKYKGTKCYISEKIDGSSSTYFIKDGIFGVCSRNLELASDDVTYHESPLYFKRTDGLYQQMHNDGTPFGETFKELPKSPTISENVYWKMARKYDIENRLRNSGKDLAIQGEIYGSGLQGNPLGIKEQKLAIFNIYDIKEKRYLNLKEMKETISHLSLTGVESKGTQSVPNLVEQVGAPVRPLELVPILNEDFTLIDEIDKLTELAKGNSVINNKKREGIVIRPKEDIYDNDYSETCQGSRISFKSINMEYLIENDA